MHFEDDFLKVHWSAVLAWLVFATLRNGGALKSHYFCWLFYKQIHKIVQYLSALWNNVVNNVLQVYVTSTMIFYAISSQNIRTSHTLKQEYGNKYTCLFLFVWSYLIYFFCNCFLCSYFFLPIVHMFWHSTPRRRNVDYLWLGRFMCQWSGIACCF